MPKISRHIFYKNDFTSISDNVNYYFKDFLKPNENKMYKVFEKGLGGKSFLRKFSPEKTVVYQSARHLTITAFCAWSLFSASSKISFA